VCWYFLLATADVISFILHRWFESEYGKELQRNPVQKPYAGFSQVKVTFRLQISVGYPVGETVVYQLKRL
jgi:hypothetical protein